MTMNKNIRYILLLLAVVISISNVVESRLGDYTRGRRVLSGWKARRRNLGYRRQLNEEKEEKKPYAEFLNAVTNTVSVVDSIANTAKNVVNLFASSSSESLVKEMKDRGYDNLNAQTTVIIKKNIKINAFYAVMSRSLKGMSIPQKYHEGVNSLIESALYIEQNSWHENDVTFATGKGGEANNFQVFTYRSMGADGCEAMQFILIGSTVGFKLAPDIFLISHSSSKMGGAFTKQSLEWKNKERPLSNDKDLEFVNKYFRTLSLSMVQELPGLFNLNKEFIVRCLKDPPVQIDPFGNGGGFNGAFDEYDAFDDEDDENNIGGYPWQNFDIGGPARCTNGQFKQWLVYLTGQAGAACTRPFFNACCSGCRPSKDMTKCYADCWNNKKATLNIPDICYEGRDPTDRSGKTPTFQGGRMMSNMKWSQQLAQCDAVGMSRCRWTGK